MEGNAHKDYGYDLEKAKKSARHYAISTGIRTVIIDALGKTLYEEYPCNETCEFCSNIETLTGGKHNCSAAHLYGTYQSERFGGVYVFFCPMGLIHWASPIKADGMVRGALIAGPVQMVDPDEFLIEDIIRKYNVTASNMIKIKSYLKEILLVETEKVNSLSEILSMVAANISNSSVDYENQEQQKQQSDISQYIHYIKSLGGDTEQSLYPIDKEKQLLSLISRGDRLEAQKLLNEILGHIFFSSGNNFNLIKARILELIVLLSRAALEGGAEIEQIFGLNYDYLNQISRFNTIEELTYWLSKIMDRFTDCVFNLADVKHIDTIYKAVDYIRKNYMRKMSLEEVSSHVYLSPSYFSKVFKEEIGTTFNAYLNNYRIEMSKKLLIGNNVELIDISNLVGFEDQSYFSKVFKKIVGISPGKFKEKRGQI